MSVHDFPQEVERIRYPEIDLSSEVGSIKGEEEEKHPKASSIVDDFVFVAVGKEVKENKSTVIWALQNSGGKKICIVHVHTPAQLIPIKSTKFPANQVGKQEAMRYHEKESNKMLKALDDYVQLCAKAGINAQKLFIEADTIENGIITLISQNMIGRLVMGAASDNRYKRNITQLKSKKAIYVHSNAPDFCQICFVCKGNLIHTRERAKPVYPNHESGETNSFISQSRTETQLSETKFDLYHDKSISRNVGVGGSTRDTDKYSTPRTSCGSSSDYESASRASLADSALPPTSSEVVRSAPSSQRRSVFALEASPLHERYHGRMSNESSSEPEIMSRASASGSARPSTSSEVVIGSPLSQRRSVFALKSSPQHEQHQERSMQGEIYDKFDILMLKAKANALESLYDEEKRRRHEIADKLAKEKKQLGATKTQHAKVVEKLGVFLLKTSSLEREIEKSNLMVEELEEKIFLAVGLLEKYKKERDDLDDNLDNALRENEFLKRQLARLNPMATQVSKFFADFSYMEILEACDNFNPSWKIGEGGFGATYKGLLRHTEVAIKLLSADSMQGPREFQQEVDTLSKLRHPNIVTLIGVCSEASALIYEYQPNGNLDDRLDCKDNTPPLSWQTRIRIATELCSVLMFLHSCQPESIIHGDLKPANILLDTHLSCKLSDFGISKAIHKGQLQTTRLYETDPKGTFAYTDPEHLSSGELTTKSDVYSFGIVLLRLLTGKPALGLAKEVQNAMDNNELGLVLDPLAGDWPFVQAKQLALLGLRCCEMQRKNRPDLELDVWRALEPMRVSSGSSSLAYKLGRHEHEHVPSYFMCPIFQEIMQDPQIAADGFTYEAEALKGWLESGHETSPMTNLRLENHTLIPNRALRSAIQEWLQQQPPCT